MDVGDDLSHTELAERMRTWARAEDNRNDILERRLEALQRELDHRLADRNHWRDRTAVLEAAANDLLAAIRAFEDAGSSEERWAAIQEAVAILEGVLES